MGEAVDRLADLVPNGHILASASATDLLVGACDEIDRLRSTIADAYETVGEDWKTCDATLAEAIAAELGEYDSANPEGLAKLIREARAARTAVGEAWFTGGATLAEAITRKCRMLEGLRVDDARASCSCCRRCGATVPCESAIADEGCDGRCFCGLDDEDEEVRRG